MNDSLLRGEFRSNKKASGIMVVMFLLGLLSLTFDIRPVEAEPGTIWIRADGSVEGTSYIQTFDNVTYFFTATINDSIIVERSGIVIDGSGFTLHGTGNGTGIDLSLRANVTVRNMQITEFDYGLYLNHSANVRIWRNNLTAISFEAVSLYESSGNTIMENNITSNTWDGIVLYGSSNNTIALNYVADNYDGVRFYESTGNTMENNFIAKSTWGIYLAASTNNTILENNIIGYWQGIPAIQSVGIDLDYQSDNNDISENSVTYNDYGIWLNSSSNSIVSENYVATNNNFGISLEFSSNNNTVIGNSVFQNGWSGIRLVGSKNNLIKWNNASYNWNEGIYSWESSDNLIVSNILSHDGTNGLYLDKSSNAYILNNYFSHNSQIDGYTAGATIYSSNVTLLKNTFEGNAVGIKISTDHNVIYHNNFIQNKIQVFLISNYYNAWDNGFEGNYWSNYTGVDLDHDGIGDTSHIIDVNNQDNHPLMSPYIPGDYNHDGAVNMTDVDMVKAAWQSRIGDLNYNPHVDFNMNNIINIADAAIIGINWQKHI